MFRTKKQMYPQMLPEIGDAAEATTDWKRISLSQWVERIMQSNKYCH